MLSLIRSLNRKWFCPLEKFGVFQQYRHGRAVDLSNLSGCFGEITGDRSCKFQILGFHSSLTRQLPDSSRSISFWELVLSALTGRSLICGEGKKRPIRDSHALAQPIG